MSKCKVQKLCGGCAGLALAYRLEAKNKQKAVETIMEQAHLDVKVLPTLMAEQAIGYRNKVIVGFTRDKDRKVVAGLYARNSHRVVDSSGCSMHPEIINEIVEEIRLLVQSMKIELYNEKTGSGLLRHVMIRWAKDTGQVMVVFVTSQRQFYSRRNLVHALTEKFPQIKTIVQNVNPRKTSIVLQDETIVLYGDGMITDRLCGLDISFSSKAFYQIHHDQCQVLYEKAKELLDLQKSDRVLDTYCGVGTIGLVLAGACKEVTGVEQNRDAVSNAIYNAKQNHIGNIRFVAMDSTRFMLEAQKFHTKFEAIVLDPPRAGTTPQFIEAACSLKPKKILYISCDPRTQARDLIVFKRFGYLADEIQPVDMFPRTEHVESIALLTYRGIRRGRYPARNQNNQARGTRRPEPRFKGKKR